MKKSILYKEKTNKMYLLILCGLLVSGAIVCSTNDNGNGGSGGGDPLMFACPNGTEVTPTADNMPTMADEENCAGCTTTGFTLQAVEGSNRMVCRTPYVCPNGTEAEGGSATMAGEENCASCTTDGFMLQAVEGSDRMVCRTPYVCPNGTAAEGVSATMAGEVNCTSCNTSFTQTAVPGSNQMTCEPNPGTNAFVCPNGLIANGTSDTADVENCASCNTAAGFTIETSMSGNEMVCRAPYVCPNGTPESGTTTMANVENCASCNTAAGFTIEASGSEMVCRTPYVCTNGTAVVDTITMADVENCSECEPGFESETQDDGRTTCSTLSIALWSTGEHDGDFGFDFCQNIIAESYTGGDADVTAQRSSDIATDLRARGYTKAVFFGSTTTYDFPNIGSDPDALALGMDESGNVSGRNIVVFRLISHTVTVTNMFDDSLDDNDPPVVRTLGNVTNVGDGGAWQNGGAAVVIAAGVTRAPGDTASSLGTSAWSFTFDGAYFSDVSCKGATTNEDARSDLLNNGNRMSVNAVDRLRASDLGGLGAACVSEFLVLCVAR